jgi:hypothetical protein
MADYVIDLAKVSISDYRKLANSRVSAPEGDEILARAAGMTLAEVQALPYNEYRALLRKFFKTASEPLADPN